MITKGQKNIKVHFAGAEVMTQFYAIEAVGVNYSLYTAFPFLERTVLKTKKSPIIPCHLKENPELIPKYIASKSKHCIQDSGLFTLMFGSHKGEKSQYLMDSWYSGLVDFTLQNNNNATIVEVDCQKVLGVKKAWEYRKKLRDAVPNRQINVLHYEDGLKGLDELIEFSNYIAISVPEARILNKKNNIIGIANYIKNKKPEIDIHLLGCTELKILKQLSFCTSSDSTSYKSSIRYGLIKKNHINNINTEKVKQLVGVNEYNNVRKYSSEVNTNAIILSTYYNHNLYSKNAGCQD